MKTCFRWIALAILCLALVMTQITTTQKVYATSQGDSITEKTVKIQQIDEHVWVHTTYENFDGIPFPSNGLIISTSDGLVLIDSSWDNKRTKRLLKKIDKQFDQEITRAIITHAHYDRIGGIRTLLKKGIDVRSTTQTAIMAVQAGYLPPLPTLDLESEFQVGDTAIETFYPGEGHTRDNIIVWLPQYNILFGGCMIRSLDTQSIGNVEDANMEEWPRSVREVMRKYPDTEIVVPGHQSWGDKSLLRHTLNLIEQYTDNQ